MECHIFPRVNGFVVDAFSRPHDQSNVACVQIGAEPLSKLMTEDGRMWCAGYGFRRYVVTNMQ